MRRRAKVDFPVLGGPVMRVVEGLLAMVSMARRWSSGVSSGVRGRRRGSAEDSVICEWC